MAEILVKNSLDSDVAVKITITLYESAIKGDIDEGDPKWVLMVGTTHLDRYGNIIPPIAVYNLIERNIDGEIEKAVNIICQKVDWGDLYVDNKAPLVVNYGPTGEDVSIKSRVSIDIKEDLPSSGLDLSGLKVTFDNGTFTYDITDEVRVNSQTFSCNIAWNPETIVKDTYH